VFCTDTVASTPHLIAHSRFGISEEEPFLAVVEPERHTSVKGATLEINGHEVGSVTPEEDYVTFEVPSFLDTDESIWEQLIPGQTSQGTGQLAYWPFRLDHNTVYDANAEPVEDNGWIFSFRIRWNEWWSQSDLSYYSCAPDNCNRADVYNTGWQVIFSFPTVDTILGRVNNKIYGNGNIIIAVRTRNYSDELGVFLASDPTWLDPVDYEDEGIEVGYPLAIFKIGGEGSDYARLFDGDRQDIFENYVLFVPMPDRVENSITLSFSAPYASIPEAQDAWFGLGYEVDWVVGQSQANVVGGVEDLVTSIVTKSYDYYIGIYQYGQFNTDKSFSAPSTIVPVAGAIDFPLYVYACKFQMSLSLIDFSELGHGSRLGCSVW
jgi:hypothetical protein